MAPNILVSGTAIVRSDGLAEALVEHYGLQGDEASEAHEAIERAINDCGVEVGDWDNPSLCSYHGDVVSRD